MALLRPHRVRIALAFVLLCPGFGAILPVVLAFHGPPASAGWRRNPRLWQALHSVIPVQADMTLTIMLRCEPVLNPVSPPPASGRSETPSEQTNAEETEAEEHAKPTLRTRLRAGVSAVLGVGSALRQRLGRQTNGLRDAGIREDSDNHGSGEAPPADIPTEAPPRRRWRASLVLVGVLIAGGIGGGAFAYTLLQQKLDQQLQESRHREAALSQKLQPAAEIRKALEEEKARRIEAEEKLASATAEYAKSTAEKQKELDMAEKHPAKLYLAEGPRTDGHGTHSLKSGDCTLDPKNIGALKRCIEEFNR